MCGNYKALNVWGLGGLEVRSVEVMSGATMIDRLRRPGNFELLLTLMYVWKVKLIACQGLGGLETIIC